MPHATARSESSPGLEGLFDNTGVYDPEENPHPFFSFLSPSLQVTSPTPPPTQQQTTSESIPDSIFDLVRSESTSTDLYPSSMEFSTGALQQLLGLSPVATSPSTTIVDGDSDTLSMTSGTSLVLSTSPTPGRLHRRALTNIKMWSHGVSRSLKARSWVA